MGKTAIVPLICVVLLGAIATFTRINAECCYHVTSSPESICYDGREYEGFYCGIKGCNMFGCNCEGGCHRNSKGYDKKEALRLHKIWKSSNNFTDSTEIHITQSRAKPNSTEVHITHSRAGSGPNHVFSHKVESNQESLVQVSIH